MSFRRSLSTPIILAIAMFVLLAVLTVGWVLLSVFGALQQAASGVYWALLPIGSTFILLLVVGVVLYLILSIKAINLTRRQSNFIDSVTHELKSPIASMKLYLQTLSRHQVSEQLQTDFHRFMLEDLERLDHLINQMLDAGRLEAERSQEEDEDVELAGLLRDCAAAVCTNYRVPVETVRLDLQPGVVVGRRIDLDIIFRNLIDNAVKYAATPPRVEVSLRPAADVRSSAFRRKGPAEAGTTNVRSAAFRRKGPAKAGTTNWRKGPAKAGTTNWLVVRIADNGPGIPPHLRRKIFGRFVRLGLELERKKPGTGLGLYIARTLVRRHRGQIRVRDPEQGPGTVFEVQLPGKELQIEN